MPRWRRPLALAAGRPCSTETWACDWISEAGRCQKALAPNYSSLVEGKAGCTAFRCAGRPLGPHLLAIRGVSGEREPVARG